MPVCLVGGASTQPWTGEEPGCIQHFPTRICPQPPAPTPSHGHRVPGPSPASLPSSPLLPVLMPKAHIPWPRAAVEPTRGGHLLCPGSWRPHTRVGVELVIPAQAGGEQGRAPPPRAQRGQAHAGAPGGARQDGEVPWPGGGTRPLSHSDHSQASRGPLGTPACPAASPVPSPCLPPARLPVTSPFCLGSFLHPCTGLCPRLGTAEPEPKKRESRGPGLQRMGAHPQTR